MDAKIRRQFIVGKLASAIKRAEESGDQSKNITIGLGDARYILDYIITHKLTEADNK